MIRRPPISTLFPSTPLFRPRMPVSPRATQPRTSPATATGRPRVRPACEASSQTSRCAKVKGRSEEHTSELQSRQYLVCRLLLEKKKKNKKNIKYAIAHNKTS